MRTYVALFRGINVGGHNILPMKELVSLLEEMGLQDVRTYIQSGNVVFRSGAAVKDKLAKLISARIGARYGFEPDVQLLTYKEFQNAVTDNPFDTKEGKALHFFFLLSEPPEPDIDKLNSLKLNSEEFKLSGKVFYLYAPDGIGRSKLAANVEKCLGVPVTGRNWNTVSKLFSMITN